MTEIEKLARENFHLEEKIAELKKENIELKDTIVYRDKRIEDLENGLRNKRIAVQTRNKRIRELEKEIKHLNVDILNQGNLECVDCYKKSDIQLVEAKKIILSLLQDLEQMKKSSDENIKKAERFLKGNPEK